MYGIRSVYSGRYRAGTGGKSAEGAQASGLEKVAAEAQETKARVVVREVGSWMPEVMVYPWVCFGCGSHMRHGDVCAFCGRGGRRVVRRWRRDDGSR